MLSPPSIRHGLRSVTRLSQNHARPASSVVPPLAPTRLDPSTASLLNDLNLGLGSSGNGGSSRERRREERQRRGVDKRDGREEVEILTEPEDLKQSSHASSSSSQNTGQDLFGLSNRHGDAEERDSNNEMEDSGSRDPRRSPASLFGTKRIGMVVLPDELKRAVQKEIDAQPSSIPLRQLYLSSLSSLTSTPPTFSASNSKSKSKSSRSKGKEPVTPLSALLKAAVDLPGEYAAVKNVIEEMRGRLGREESLMLGLGWAGEGERKEEKRVEGEAERGGVVIWDSGIGSGVWSLLNLPTEGEMQMNEESEEHLRAAHSESGPSTYQISPDSHITYIHPSRHMLDLSSRLLSSPISKSPETPASNPTRPLTFSRRYVPTRPTPPTLVLSTFHLSTLPTMRARATRIQEMIDTGAEMFVFVEEGTEVGWKAILEAREQVLRSGEGAEDKTKRKKGKSKNREDAEEVDDEEDVIEIGGEKFYPVQAGGQEPSTAKESQYHVVAPCPHDKPCPLASSNSRDICSFSQRFQSPTFFRRTKHSTRGESDFRYTYVVLRRGKRPQLAPESEFAEPRELQGRVGAVAIEERLRTRQKQQAEARGEIVEVQNGPDGSFEVMHAPSEENAQDGGDQQEDVDMNELRKEAYDWPRLVFPPLKRSGHVVMDTCHPSGSIVRLTLPRSHSKQAFYDARKTTWGDLFPHTSKSAEAQRPRGVRRLAKVEGSALTEEEEEPEIDREVERLMEGIEWPVAELVDVDSEREGKSDGKEENGDHIVRTFG